MGKYAENMQMLPSTTGYFCLMCQDIQSKWRREGWNGVGEREREGRGRRKEREEGGKG